ncbi:MAG: hypothetical protein Q9221_001615 [Calogaya cf. arnoldii]
MSSFTNRFKRSRSKSDKLITPPKIVFGDLNSAYKSIAQKTPPHSPGGRLDLHGESSGLAGVRPASSPIPSPHSEASPPVVLSRSRPSDTIRISHLSGDLFLPRSFDRPEPKPKPKPPATWDPFDASKRTSFTTLEVTKDLLDDYFGVSPRDRVQASQEQDQSRAETKILPASDYPELEHAQLKACSVLSGLEEHNQADSGADVDRCGTVQSVPKRHPYGRVNTNENIRSIHGFPEEDTSGRCSEHAQHNEVEEVQWTPRSSMEAGAFSGMSKPGQEHPGVPPSVSLPRTPQGQETERHRFNDLSSPSKEGSRSSESYGNTQRLLQMSLSRLPEAPIPSNNLYHQLLDFAREGQSSSSQGDSSMSFAEFRIEEAHGAQITRLISQDEFQHLQRTISEHRRRESHLSDEATGGSQVRVGQISFMFPDTSSEVDLGPGSSQTTSSKSEVEVNWETRSAHVPIRTRNGTPPLLFGAVNHARNDHDWETVGESNELTSSIADVSDSTSGGPPGNFPSLPPGQVLRHPPHPRYNHSWDLQQDVRSGAFVLTPRYQQLPAGNSFPNQNALQPLSLRAGPSNYSHPTPLTVSHDNPFVTPPVRITPEQHLATANTQSELQSQGTSAWLSTVGGSDAFTTSAYTEIDKLAAAPLPPIPSKNPSRRWRQKISQEPLHHRRSFNFGFRSSKSKLDQVSSMEEGSAAYIPACPIAVLPADLAPQNALGGPSSSIRLRSPHRHAEETAATLQRPPVRWDDEDDFENPFNDPIDQGKSVSGRRSPATNPFASTLILPEDTYSPSHRGRAQADRTLDFITADQANYMRSKSPEWTPNNIEMQAIISPQARTRNLAVPSPVSPRLWKPNPHPLAHLGPREESPHLRRLRKQSATARRKSHQQLVSRYYLMACACVPFFPVLYFLGCFDWLMRMHTGGVYRKMGSHEKKLAVLIFCMELLSCAAFVPLIYSVV